MVSLRLSSSRSSATSSSSLSQSFKDAQSSLPASASGSASTSSESLHNGNEAEDATITPARALPPIPPSETANGRRQSQENLRLLAISTHMTELSYSISDIQTRIFEIQELRHKSQSSGDTAGTTSIIDQSLMNLDERLESVAKGMKTIADRLAPFSQSPSTPTASSHDAESNEIGIILRKHSSLLSEWEAVQDESEILREELKEDKWLTVFRTVTDQADGMMSSLEKAVNRCQDFIWQVHRRIPSESCSSLSMSSSGSNDKITPNFETFVTLLESFEAKKKHYMPATSKVLSIIDKGVQDRVTKNGETLRRHADSAQRWKNLRERIARTDKEMEAVRKFLVFDVNPSDAGSSTSGFTNSSAMPDFLSTPPPKSRTASVSSTMSRSMSPFRKLAQKITRSTKSPSTPVSNSKSAAPSSEPPPANRPQRSSMFPFNGTPAPVTPDRSKHKPSQSSALDSPLAAKRADPNATMKSQALSRQKWNSSTRVESESFNTTIKGLTYPRRAPADGTDFHASSVVDIYKRSPSRSSVASSRPWTPVNSSASTAPSNLSINPQRPPSRTAQTSSRTRVLNATVVPKARPMTPSQIPVPSSRDWMQSDGPRDDDDETPTTLMQRAFSPAFSASGVSLNSPQTPRSQKSLPPRPPSRSMIPVPSLHFSSASRPSSAMSNYSESPNSSPFRSSAMRAQTPEPALRARVQNIPFYQGARTPVRPPMPQKTPPSSFREVPITSLSRPSSRAGASTPVGQDPVHEYHPSNPQDPLDAEVAAVVNSIAHGLLVERVDPPLRTIPKEGEEIKAQYAFSNSLARKVVTCRLTTLTRITRGTGKATSTKKVMCRVGGGWQDLQLYMLNRQAGL